MGFAALETRVNAAVLAKLVNATATLAGEPVAGIFEADYQDAIGMSGNAPAFTGDTTALAAAGQGTALTVDCASLGLAAAAYVVTEQQPEHGITRLVLQAA